MGRSAGAVIRLLLVGRWYRVQVIRHLYFAYIHQCLAMERKFSLPSNRR